MNYSDKLAAVTQLNAQLENENVQAILITLRQLKKIDMTLDILRKTGVDKTVNKLRKHEGVAVEAKPIVAEWKTLLRKREYRVTSFSVLDENDEGAPRSKKRKSSKSIEGGAVDDQTQDRPPIKMTLKLLPQVKAPGSFQSNTLSRKNFRRTPNNNTELNPVHTEKKHPSKSQPSNIRSVKCNNIYSGQQQVRGIIFLISILIRFQFPKTKNKLLLMRHQM